MPAVASSSLAGSPESFFNLTDFFPRFLWVILSYFHFFSIDFGTYLGLEESSAR
jgi:hypothetical protein